MNFAQIQEKLGEVKIEDTWVETPEHKAYEISYTIDNCVYNFMSFKKDGSNSYLTMYSKRQPQKSGSETANVTTSITPQSSTQETSLKSLSNYNGVWYEEAYKKQANQYGNLVPGGTEMKITFLNSESGLIEFTRTQSPPASRIANFSTIFAMVDSKNGTFSFDDDGWGNKGKGTIGFEQDTVTIIIKMELSNPHAMWGIFSGQRVFVRIPKSFQS
jgi:hypothetical protein